MHCALSCLLEYTNSLILLKQPGEKLTEIEAITGYQLAALNYSRI